MANIGFNFIPTLKMLEAQILPWNKWMLSSLMVFKLFHHPLHILVCVCVFNSLTVFLWCIYCVYIIIYSGWICIHKQSKMGTIINFSKKPKIPCKHQIIREGKMKCEIESMPFLFDRDRKKKRATRRRMQMRKIFIRHRRYVKTTFWRVQSNTSLVRPF